MTDNYDSNSKTEAAIRVFQSRLNTHRGKLREICAEGAKLKGTRVYRLLRFFRRSFKRLNGILDKLESLEAGMEGMAAVPEDEEINILLGSCPETRAREPAPKISIVVLTYNNLELSKICVDSILSKTAYPNYELIIVDNCSSDGTAAWLGELEARNKPKVKTVLNSKNIGFAAGNNIGIRAADGEYIVLLNNDTRVTSAWLTNMAKHLQSDPSLGMIGPVTNAIGNEAKINVDYFDYDGLDLFALHYASEHSGERFENPGVLAMFCVMIRREVIEKCGLLCEEYGRALFEDDDYSMAVRAAGYRLAIAEDAFVHHFENRTINAMKREELTQLFLTNKALFEKRWNTTWVPHTTRPGVGADTNRDNTLL